MVRACEYDRSYDNLIKLLVFRNFEKLKNILIK